MKAFPRQITFNNGVVKGEWIDDGMDLRDYFAAKAMQAYLLKGECDNLSIKQITKGAYVMADAMMKAREE